MKGRVIQACFLGLIQNLNAQRDSVIENGWHFVMPCYNADTGEVAQGPGLTKVKVEDRYALPLQGILSTLPFDQDAFINQINAIGGGQGGADGVVPVFLRAQFNLLTFLDNLVNELHKSDFGGLAALKKFKVNLGGFQQDFDESVAAYIEPGNEELGTFMQFSSHVNKLKSELDALHTQIVNANEPDDRVEIEIAARRIISTYFNGAQIPKSNRLKLHEVQEAFTAEEKRINDLLQPLLDRKKALETNKCTLEREIKELKDLGQKTTLPQIRSLRYKETQELPQIEGQLAECSNSIKQLQADLEAAGTRTAEQVTALMTPPNSPKDAKRAPSGGASSSSSSAGATSGNAAPVPAPAPTPTPTKKDASKPSINYSNIICGVALFATCAIGLILITKKFSLNSIKLSDVFSKISSSLARN